MEKGGRARARVCVDNTRMITQTQRRWHLLLPVVATWNDAGVKVNRV